METLARQLFHLSGFCLYYFPAIYSSWRHQKISAMDIFGILWSAARQAALSLAYRGFPAVSHYCCVPCWPASCFMASPVTLLNRLWTWVRFLFPAFYFLLQKETSINIDVWNFSLKILTVALLFLTYMTRLLLILEDGLNCIKRKINFVYFPLFFLLSTGHFEFTWQQFMIGVQSSLIMFPINIVIVSIFRLTRPREHSCCKCKRDTSDVCSSQTDTQTVNDNVTLESVMKVCILIDLKMIFWLVHRGCNY